MTWQYRIGLTTWQKKEFITGETKAGDSEAKEKEKEKKGKKKPIGFRSFSGRQIRSRKLLQPVCAPQ